MADLHPVSLFKNALELTFMPLTPEQTEGIRQKAEGIINHHHILSDYTKAELVLSISKAVTSFVEPLQKELDTLRSQSDACQDAVKLAAEIRDKEKARADALQKKLATYAREDEVVPERFHGLDTMVDVVEALEDENKKLQAKFRQCEADCAAKHEAVNRYNKTVSKFLSNGKANTEIWDALIECQQLGHPTLALNSGKALLDELETWKRRYNELTHLFKQQF